MTSPPQELQFGMEPDVFDSLRAELGSRLGRGVVSGRRLKRSGSGPLLRDVYLVTLDDGSSCVVKTYGATQTMREDWHASCAAAEAAPHTLNPLFAVKDLSYFVLPYARGIELATRVKSGTGLKWCQTAMRWLSDLHASSPRSEAPLLIDEEVITLTIDCAELEISSPPIVRAFAKASEFFDDNALTVLCGASHGDFHPFNILVDAENDDFTVIDFGPVSERPRERDLAMFLVQHDLIRGTRFPNYGNKQRHRFRATMLEAYGAPDLARAESLALCEAIVRLRTLVLLKSDAMPPWAKKHWAILEDRLGLWAS